MRGAQRPGPASLSPPPPRTGLSSRVLGPGARRSAAATQRSSLPSSVALAWVLHRPSTVTRAGGRAGGAQRGGVPVPRVPPLRQAGKQAGGHRSSRGAPAPSPMLHGVSSASSRSATAWWGDKRGVGSSAWALVLCQTQVSGKEGRGMSCSRRPRHGDDCRVRKLFTKGRRRKERRRLL